MAADKNLGVVVMDREDYVEMCQSHLMRILINAHSTIPRGLGGNS